MLFRSSNRTPGKMLKFVRLGEKESADGFDEAPAVSSAPTPKNEGKTTTPTAKAAGKPTQAAQSESKPKFDLNSILG